MNIKQPDMHSSNHHQTAPGIGDAPTTSSSGAARRQSLIPVAPTLWAHGSYPPVIPHPPLVAPPPPSPPPVPQLDGSTIQLTTRRAAPITVTHSAASLTRRCRLHNSHREHPHPIYQNHNIAASSPGENPFSIKPLPTDGSVLGPAVQQV